MTPRNGRQVEALSERHLLFLHHFASVRQHKNVIGVIGHLSLGHFDNDQ